MPRYLLYARKSTESEDRQVLSIDSQVKELTAFARSRDFAVAGVLSESRSAKSPGRAVFGELLREIAHGKADGILCWKLDRLARNPVDGGALIWALDEGHLREIVTPERAFTNTGSDKFWMQLEFGIAKKYVDDLSDNVRRGFRAKLARGWFPGLPPLGYMNDPRTKTIVLDPERAPLVRKIWDLVLAGERPLTVLDRANRTWGFRTRVFGQNGGRPLAPSAFYRLLETPFYYGLLVRNGESFPGAHEPLITKDEYDRVQRILRRPNRKTRHAFAFTGLIRCGECGMSVTAQYHVNPYGSEYVHYHCSKRRKDYRCRQRTLSLPKLEEQILSYLARIRLGDRYRDWAMTWVRTRQAEDEGARAAAVRSAEEARASARKRLDALTELRLRDLLTDEEYAGKRKALVAEELELRRRSERAEGDGAEALELSGKALIFADQARKRFAEGSLEEKREILVALGSNFTLMNRILTISLQKPFLWIEEGREFRSGVGLMERMRTFFREHPRAIAWPKWCERARYGFRIASPSNGRKMG
jgi:DNA invertase Pin-like site-specific DNA recombinase